MKLYSYHEGLITYILFEVEPLRKQPSISRGIIKRIINPTKAPVYPELGSWITFSTNHAFVLSNPNDVLKEIL